MKTIGEAGAVHEVCEDSDDEAVLGKRTKASPPTPRLVPRRSGERFLVATTSRSIVNVKNFARLDTSRKKRYREVDPRAVDGQQDGDRLLVAFEAVDGQPQLRFNLNSFSRSSRSTGLTR